MHVFKLLSPIQKVASGEDKLKIVGYASTADTDRSGDVIIPSAWTSKGGLDNFKSNPIILFNHNYSAPIGKAVELEVDQNGLKITCEISKSAGDVYGLISDNVLSTFSVGFMIKDADYNSVTDGYIIKDAELLEVSVVSVPCNQAATFSITKSLKSNEEIQKFNQEVNALDASEHVDSEVNTSEVDDVASAKTGEEISPPEKLRMTEEEMLALMQKMADQVVLKQQEAAKAEADKKAAVEAEEARIKSVVATMGKDEAEKITEAFETKLKENNDNWEKTFGEMKNTLEEKSKELLAMRDSKRGFHDRGTDSTTDEKAVKEAEDIFLLSKIQRKTFKDTLETSNIGKNFVQKFNTHSTVSVGNDNLETTVSTNIERDIWNELILAPLFREISMNSAQLTIPIMPDAGYAEITSNTTASGSQPNGNMDPRGAGYGAPYQGLTLSEITLSTIKMIAKSYLGNETEEDAILPILPLIRDAMARSHARGVENLFLAGNHIDGVYTSGAVNGLLNIASTGGRTITTAANNTKLTSAALFGMRKLMGKYGLQPNDVVYVVSQQAYFELIEDPEFADADLVGSQANKLTGEVGKIYGSTVIMCDEFAAPAPGKYFALALNRRNFVVPRLRGITVESEYQVENQRQVLVTSQRLGFNEIITGATSVVGLKYAA